MSDTQSAPALRHQAAHLLQSESLTVEVMDPLDPERYNRGVRFSPVANVLRVVAEGRDFLFSPVEHRPLTENAGLAMEFDISEENPPPGFWEADFGDGFLKVGVGVLRKDVEIYKFFKDYEVIDPAKTAVVWGKDFARFEQICGGIRGYAYRLNAEVRVKANVLEITCALANTGTQPFSSEQYTHNYFLLGDGAVGDGYGIEFSHPVQVMKGLTPGQIATDRAIEFCGSIAKVVNLDIAPTPTLTGAGELTVQNKHNGMAIRSHVSRPVTRIAIHAVPSYFCPEQFVRLELQPGQSTEWTRRFEFGVG